MIRRSSVTLAFALAASRRRGATDAAASRRSSTSYTLEASATAERDLGHAHRDAVHRRTGPGSRAARIKGQCADRGSAREGEGRDRRWKRARATTRPTRSTIAATRSPAGGSAPISRSRAATSRRSDALAGTLQPLVKLSSMTFSLSRRAREAAEATLTQRGADALSGEGARNSQDARLSRATRSVRSPCAPRARFTAADVPHCGGGNGRLTAAAARPYRWRPEKSTVTVVVSGSVILGPAK